MSAASSTAPSLLGSAPFTPAQTRVIDAALGLFAEQGISVLPRRA